MGLWTPETDLEDVDAALDRESVIALGVLATPSGLLKVSLTARLRRACRKARVWKSAAMLTALKNARYGLDPARVRSRGGADGIFLLDRSHRPKNAMMKKLFSRFLDRPDPLVAVLAARGACRPEDLIPVRLVSHHLRLLGVVVPGPGCSELVLVDCDDTKD